MRPAGLRCNESVMKKILKGAEAVAVALCVMAAMASCGGGVNKEERLQAAVASLDSVLAECEAPVTAIKAVADGKDIRVDAVVRDSLIRFEAVGDALMNYYLAQQLKQSPAKVFNAVVKAVEGTDGAVVLSVADIYDFKREYKYTGAQLRNLYKALPSQLDGGKVKAELCAMLEPSLPNRAAWAQAQSVELSVKGGFLTYTVTFPDESRYANSGQGLLTGLYEKPLVRSYSSLGSLCGGFEAMCGTLGIEGVRVEYKASKGDKELSQAFPWRFIFVNE